MALLLQLNGELPEHFPGHERRLYVFACRNRSCRRRDGSVRALRAVRVTKRADDKAKREGGAAAEVEQPKQSQKPAPLLGEALFGTKSLGGGAQANPFASPASAAAPSAAGKNPFAPPSASTPAAAAPAAAAPSNPFSAPAASATSTLPQTFAAALTLNAAPSTSTIHGPPPPPEPWPAPSALPRPYPTLYLSDAEYEALDRRAEAEQAARLAGRTQYLRDGEEEDAGVGGGGKAGSSKVFESDMDAAFQRFADRLAQNPEQVIRYEFGGVPLLCARDDVVGKLLSPQHEGSSSSAANRLPRCPNCGDARTFEVQLMPRAIAELEDGFEYDDEPATAAGKAPDGAGTAAAGLDAGMEWVTILVGVCEQDCQVRGVADGSGEAGYLEEWAGVQWESTKVGK